MQPAELISQTKIRVVAFCVKGRFQSYLINRLNERYELIGVVYCDSSHIHQQWRRLLKYFNPLMLYRYLLSHFFLPKYELITEQNLALHYPEFVSRQSPPQNLNALTVEDINDFRVAEFVQRLNPDVVCVNGTNLIREPLLSICSKLKLGIINLHTGLSPYSRGGNCNLHMLLENQPHLVGATVHYIDAGIDSGNIIHTLRPVMNADDPYEYIEAKVFISGVNALVGAVEKVADGAAQNVAQWEEGKLFLKRTGYQYSPYLRLIANQKINKGLIADYLMNKEKMDKPVRLVE